MSKNSTNGRATATTRQRKELPATETGRLTFADIQPVLEYPDFLGVQLQSFADFAQADVAPEERDPSKCLQGVFLEHFPITDSRERYTLEFLHY